MKKYFPIAFLIFIATPLLVLAQDDMKIPLIEVEGYSEVKIAPDEAEFHIMLEEKSIKVEDAINALNAKTELLARRLKNVRIKDYKLIADNYSVNINRIYQKGTPKDSGYIATQQLRIVTNSNSEDLQKIVDAIKGSGDMGFNLEFKVSEIAKRSLEDELLKQALLNAESRALLIARTLNIKSIRVHRVLLANEQNNYYPRMEIMRAVADDNSTSQAMLNPDEQKISKKVYVKYTY